MVQSIEQYGDVLKVILKPTKNFPEGRNYFYCNASARELVDEYTWVLYNDRCCIYAIRINCVGTTPFHCAYAELYGIDNVKIDHINGVGMDNRDVNLNVVDFYQNNRNRASKGYVYQSRDGKFVVKLTLDKTKKYIGTYSNEYDALKSAYRSRHEYYTDYDYNFLLDRKNDLDILDDELTGKITTEEATFRHVMRYAKDNAWYVYRYGLEEYFNSRGIQIPTFELDSKGYMIDTITKERLCPFK